MVRTRAIWLPLWFRILPRFTRGPLDCPEMSAGYMAESNPCTALPIGPIAKLKVHAREFVFCDRRIECVVANKISPYRQVANQADVELDLTRFSQARMLGRFPSS
jgi:hypothetical protein